MAEKKPKVGDLVSHEGNWAGHDHEETDFKIVRFQHGGEDPNDPLRLIENFQCVFESNMADGSKGGRRVTCATADLVWLDEDKAWMLPGRLITKPQRVVFCILTESSACSPKAHVSARYALLQDAKATAVAMEAVPGWLADRAEASQALAATLVEEEEESDG